jgi:hypothetical protein
MQATPDIATNTPTISEEDAHRIACDYVATHINPAYQVPGRAYLDSRAFERQVWRFIICFANELLDAMEVDAHTGAVIQLSDDEIRLIHERAIIYAAEQRGVLPVNAQRYVVSEYARRQADRYVCDTIAPFFHVIEPLFIPHYMPHWRVKIVFKLRQCDPYILGTMNVDATTGEPIPLTQRQLDHIHERVRAFVASDSDLQPATAPPDTTLTQLLAA